MKHRNVNDHSFCIHQHGRLAQDRASGEVRGAHGCRLGPQEAETQAEFGV